MSMVVNDDRFTGCFDEPLGSEKSPEIFVRKQRLDSFREAQFSVVLALAVAIVLVVDISLALLSIDIRTTLVSPSSVGP